MPRRRRDKSHAWTGSQSFSSGQIIEIRFAGGFLKGWDSYAGMDGPGGCDGVFDAWVYPVLGGSLMVVVRANNYRAVKCGRIGIEEIGTVCAAFFAGRAAPVDRAVSDDGRGSA